MNNICDYFICSSIGANNTQYYIINQANWTLVISAVAIVAFIVGIIIGWYRGKHPVIQKSKDKWHELVKSEKLRQQIEEEKAKEKRILEVMDEGRKGKAK
jgi:phage terminase large subunit-like protein